jgi:hypothetical protein
MMTTGSIGMMFPFVHDEYRYAAIDAQQHAIWASATKQSS